MAKNVITRKKRKKVKFRKLVIKLSDKQTKQVQKCSVKQKTSSNKLIKLAIKEYLTRHANLLVEEPNYVTKNQLKLFDFDKMPEQMNIFAIIEKEEEVGK
jgi:hypothetical protein